MWKWFFATRLSILFFVPIKGFLWDDIHTRLTPFERLTLFGQPETSDFNGSIYEVIHPYHPLARFERAVPRGTSCPPSLHRTFTVFNRTITLKLKKSDHILNKLSFHGSGDMKSVVPRNDICGYRFGSPSATASVHVTGRKYTEITGFFFDGEGIYRIAPIPQRLVKRFNKGASHGPPHVVVRIPRKSDDFDDEDLNTLKDLQRKLENQRFQGACGVDEHKECPSGSGKCRYDNTYPPPLAHTRSAQNRGTVRAATGHQATLELAVFVDASATKVLKGYLGDDASLHNFLLVFVDQVDLLLHLPSFGTPVDVKLVSLNLLQTNPAKIPADGDVDTVLAAFSEYQKGLNAPADEDPNHWDHAVYLTGRKLSRGGTDYSVMGMSRIGAVCDPRYSATVAELGARDKSGNPVQSSGFLSTYMVAHEIGHSVGLLHDGDTNNCVAGENIMSAVRGWSGQTTWSTCSQSTIQEKLPHRGCLYESSDLPVIANLDFRLQKLLPGQIFTSNAQCGMQTKDRLFVRDPKQKLNELCASLHCKNIGTLVTAAIGPALDGTYCGGRNWCSGGDCVPWPYELPLVQPGWSGWSKGACQSGCIEQSTGFQVTSRSCTEPEPHNTEASCKGEDRILSFCSYTSMCAEKQSVNKYANMKCQMYYSAGVPGITAEGKQYAFDRRKPNASCAIYCKTESEDTYKHPKNAVSLLLGQEAYFPDGTWCNRDGQTNFYCLNQQCVPLTA